jgi:SagB-type dehydrogenase family enzyme
MVSGWAQELKTISLPAPDTTGGKPLMTALKERQTRREMASAPLASADLSNLLWAAFGINRPENDHRTAPSAMNSQEIDLYVATADGVFVYEPKPHVLRQISQDDIRSLTSGQDHAKTAPVILLFVADLSRLAKARPETRSSYASFDAGCISQNVYLYCASAGLATVVYDLDRVAVAKRLNFGKEQQIIMAQAVGHSR